jgi:predicted ATP-grasp superfamily ATP-dependent carboligase
MSPGQLGVQTVITLGAYLADVPAHASDSDQHQLRRRESVQDRFGAEASEYQGPTGIVGDSHRSRARAAGIESLSCWAAVPHYAGGPPSPKAALALLGRLEEVLDVSIPARAIADEAKAWERGVDEMAESDEEVADYVQSSGGSHRHGRIA